MTDMTRRALLGAVATSAVAAQGLGSLAFAGEAAQPVEAYGQIAPDQEIVEATGWTGTPAHIEAVGGSTMPLEALNIYRRRYIDHQTAVTLADGRTIPEVYVKVRALINTYGIGIGDGEMLDNTFDDMMDVLSERDAQMFLDMPWGQEFRALDYSVKTGLPLEECEEYLERLAREGYIFRIVTSAGNAYHQMPNYQGIEEVRHIMKLGDDPSFNCGLMAEGWDADKAGGGSSVIFAIPCTREVVTGSEILPYDDIEQIIEAQTTFAIAPCACRFHTLMDAVAAGELDASEVPTLDDLKTGAFEDWFSPLANRRLETCLHMGDEARYHIANGNAREITKEDALRYMRRSLEDGFVIQKLFTKGSQTVCSCDRDSCLSMWEFTYFGQDAAKIRPFDQSRSHYELEVDREACLKCGACSQRCPMRVIYMDEETGYPIIGDPEVGELCFRCGQCAYVCPAGARALVARPAEELLEQRDTILDDHNMKAAFRFEHGMLA